MLLAFAYRSLRGFLHLAEQLADLLVILRQQGYRVLWGWIRPCHWAAPLCLSVVRPQCDAPSALGRREHGHRSIARLP
jgi:hypothetical protein